MSSPAIRNRALAHRLAAGCFALCVLALLLACGDDDDGPTDVPSPSPVTASPNASSSTAPATTGTPDLPAGMIDVGSAQPLFIAYGAGQGDFPSDQPGLAVADLNGDGFDDVAAGTRFADGPGGTDSGAAYVIFGGASLPDAVDFAAGEAGLTIYGAGAGASLGFSAAAGDLNGDGQADMALGAPFTSFDGQKLGSVHVFFGPLATGVTELAVTPADVTLRGTGVTSFFGDSLATGDVDDDGVADLVVGATFAREANGPAGGAVYVFSGGEDWAAEMAADDADVAFYGAEEFDELGDFVVTGDINGDGVEDIVATAEAADGPGNSRDTGAEVHVLFGGSGLEGTRRVADGDGDVVVYGAAMLDTLGFALASGDLDGDGRDEIAMSAHLASPGGVARAGATYILFGREDWPAEVDLAAETEGLAVITGASPSDLLATSLAITEAGELVLGVSLGDAAGRQDAGLVYVFAVGQVTPGSTLGAGQAAGPIYYGAAAGDRFGANVAEGDVDGDGRAEWVVVAELAPGPDASRPEAGRVYVLGR